MEPETDACLNPSLNINVRLVIHKVESFTVVYAPMFLDWRLWTQLMNRIDNDMNLPHRRSPSRER